MQISHYTDSVTKAPVSLVLIAGAQHNLAVLWKLIVQQKNKCIKIFWNVP